MPYGAVSWFVCLAVLNKLLVAAQASWPLKRNYHKDLMHVTMLTNATEEYHQDSIVIGLATTAT